MNIGQIGRFAYESFQKISNSRLTEKGPSAGNENKVPAKDKFEKNDNIKNYTTDIEQLVGYTKSLPDIREDKLADIDKQISDGYYSQDQFLETLSENLAKVI